MDAESFGRVRREDLIADDARLARLDDKNDAFSLGPPVASVAQADCAVRLTNGAAVAVRRPSAHLIPERRVGAQATPHHLRQLLTEVVGEDSFE